VTPISQYVGTWAEAQTARPCTYVLDIRSTAGVITKCRDAQGVGTLHSQQSNGIPVSWRRKKTTRWQAKLGYRKKKKKNAKTRKRDDAKMLNAKTRRRENTKRENAATKHRRNISCALKYIYGANDNRNA